MRFHSNLRVYNNITGALGKPYYKRCSIPQGCPFSMMLIALLLRILICRIPGVLVLRILADDILLLGFGSEHLPVFIEKFESISSFLQHMGSRVSAKKSFLFSSTSDGRDFLKRYVWDFVGTTLRLVHDFRDVGAHLCIIVALCVFVLGSGDRKSVV